MNKRTNTNRKKAKNHPRPAKIFKKLKEKIKKIRKEDPNIYPLY